MQDQKQWEVQPIFCYTRSESQRLCTTQQEQGEQIQRCAAERTHTANNSKDLCSISTESNETWREVHHGPLQGWAGASRGNGAARGLSAVLSASSVRPHCGSLHGAHHAVTAGRALNNSNQYGNSIISRTFVSLEARLSVKWRVYYFWSGRKESNY